MANPQDIDTLIASIQPVSGAEILNFGADAVRRINEWAAKNTSAAILDLLRDPPGGIQPIAQASCAPDFGTASEPDIALQRRITVQRPVGLKKSSATFFSFN